MTTQLDRFISGRPTVRLLAIATIGAAALTACGSSSSGPSTSSTSNTSTSSKTTTSRVANITITQADGCKIDTTTLPAGALTFNVANKDATGVSEVELQSGERIVGERENLPAGFNGSFAVNIDAGSYTLYCPGASSEDTTINVTGTAATRGNSTTTALLSSGTKDYASYVSTQVGYLKTAVKSLNTAVHGTNLKAAQAAYERARPFYEKIEPVAETFTLNHGKTNLDANIDARFGDVPKSQWQGFHPIEQLLFQKHTLKGTTTLGDGLVTNVNLLVKKAKGLTYKPYELANGAQDLLEEVASSKITGEEERYSHIDLLDFEGNDEGAEQAFADLQPGLAKIDSGLAKTITLRFKSLDHLVDSYRTGSNPSGFVYYSALTKNDTRKLAAAVKAVQEPLSQVASKVARA